MLLQYFNCNKRLEIFLTCFCNILCYVGEFYNFSILFLNKNQMTLGSEILSLIRKRPYTISSSLVQTHILWHTNTSKALRLWRTCISLLLIVFCYSDISDRSSNRNSETQQSRLLFWSMLSRNAKFSFRLYNVRGRNPVMRNS